MDGRCKTCRWWGYVPPEQQRWRRAHSITEPVDPDTYKPMVMPFEVRECGHPKLLFFERPVEEDGFAVADGSQYMAVFVTGPEFGCVRHEAAE